MGWEDTIQDEPEEKKDEASWEKTIQDDADAPGMLESGARGFTSGATLGLASNLSGAMGAIGDVALGTVPFSEIGKSFDEYKADYQEGDQKAREANTNTFGASEFVGGAVGPGSVASKGLGTVGKMIAPRAATALEAAATSPLPQRVAAAVTKRIPKSLETVTDAVNTYGGRVASLSNPVTGFVQGAKDLEKGIPVVQKGLAWMLDNVPQKLGKLLPIVKEAAARGPAALATTEFLLGQSDPEFQAMKKEIEEN